MKPNADPNCFIRVRHQAWDELGTTAPFYKGIYSVTLNNRVEFFFVPAFERDIDCAFSVPENADLINSEEEARGLTAALSSYCITPSKQLAPRAATVVIPSLALEIPTHQVALFFVSSELFEVFSQELEFGASIAGDLHSSERLTSFLHTFFVRFLFDTVITSNSFQPADKRWLGMR